MTSIEAQRRVGIEKGSARSSERHSAAIVNAMSVDVEDYYQVGAFESTVSREDWSRFEPRVERNTDQILEILSQRKVKATFFVLGYVAERWPEIVRRVVLAGHELAAHGYDHRRVTDMSPAEFRGDVRKTKQVLEDTGAVEVLGYRAPSYSIGESNLWAMDILLEEGFRYDSSIFPIHHDKYGMPRAPRFPWEIRRTNGSVLMEFPISTVRILGVNLPFVGGGYLRQFPFWFTRWGVTRVNSVDQRPVVVYIHPWEIDPEQPRVRAGWLSRFRHYRNLAKTRPRLDTLLRTYEFTTMREVLGI